VDGGGLVLQVILDNGIDGLSGWPFENENFKLASMTSFLTGLVHLGLRTIVMNLVVFDGQGDKFVSRSHHSKNEFEGVLAWVGTIVADSVSVTAIWLY
jgi:hypothetical protein